MRRLILLPIYCLVFLFAGCVGVGMEISYPGTYSYEQIDVKEDLIKRRGNPTRVEKISESEEILYYKSGSWYWNGIMPYVAIGIPIPIPIFFPVAHEVDEYRMNKHGVSFALIRHTSKETNCFVGYGLINEASSDTKFYLSCGNGYPFLPNRTPSSRGFELSCLPESDHGADEYPTSIGLKSSRNIISKSLTLIIK